MDASTARLADAFDGTGADAWAATVRTARGRTVPAGEVPWMRIREVWVHAVDLDAGTAFAEVPLDLADALLVDALTGRLPLDDIARVRVVATDTDLDVTIGSSATEATTVAAPASQLLAWALGRPGPESDAGGRPPLGRWL